MNIAISVAAGMVLVSVITVRVKISYQMDGPSINYYGFPFPYYRFSQVSSLQYNIDWGRYLLNSLFYSLTVYAILFKSKLRSKIEKYYKRFLLITALLLPFPTFMLWGELFILGKYSCSVRLFDHELAEVEEIRLHIGWEKPY